MELPTVSGILRRSPEMGRDSLQFEEIAESSPPLQDKGSVRFVDEKMNNKLLGTPVEKVRFSYDQNEIENITEEDDDYSASVSAILQRRASSRRGKRRSSSPFSHEDFSTQSTPRRRSSAFTTTSETAISIDDIGVKEEQIFDNIRLHKEVITNVKHQPWSIRRKLKLIEQAKSYVTRHEGELQVRLKKSRSTRDIWTRFNIVLVKKWNHTKREIINFMNLLIPWELRIKEIESHFGTVVASYFTFLRWLFWVNLVISIILTTFVIVPEVLHNSKKKELFLRKQPPPDERKITLDVLLNFEGILKYSPLFYGYYSDHEEDGKYKIPTAYFMIGVGVYIYSFIATLRKMAVNFRLSKLSEKEDECIFTWKLFSGWDYMIGNAETGHNRTSSIVLGFKEALLEEAEKRKEKRSWKIISIRIFVNLNVLWMLIFSARTVVVVVNKTSDRADNVDSWADKDLPFIVKWWYQNETTIVMTVISNVFPFLFELFGFIEKYHPRKTLRIQLARIMVLNLLNLYTMTFALFNQIDGMTKELDSIKNNVTLSLNTSVILPIPPTTTSPNTVMDNSFVLPLDFLHSFKDYDYNDPKFHSLNKREIAIPSSENPQSTTSLAELFFKHQPDFTDPATGTYNKPISIYENGNLVKLEILNMTKNEDSTNSRSSEGILHTTTLSMDFINKSATTKSIMENGITIIDDLKSTNDYDDITSWRTENTSDYVSQSTTSAEMSEIWFEESNDTTTTDSISYKLTDTSNLIDLTTPTYSTEIGNTFATIATITKINSEFTTLKENDSRNIIPTTNAVTETNILTNTITNFSENTSEFSTVISVTGTDVISAISCSGSKNENVKYGAIPASILLSKTDNATQQRLRRLCWETMFGQELVKLTAFDLGANFLSTFGGDFIRALLVRYLNKFWCWDLEKKFPKYADFKIAENILHLVNNQGMVWMGMFFSPGLPLLNVAKLMIMMYLRSWAVLTCNVPHEVVFRASRSNNFYLALLLTQLFLCVLPVCYAIVWLKPSWHCGPFSNNDKIYLIFAATLRDILPKKFHKFMEYMATPGTVIPLMIVLLLIIYYLASLTSALREANIDLKIQLRRERTEERKKMFEMARRRKRGGSDLDSTLTKWKKILQEGPSVKMSEDSSYIDLIDDHRDISDEKRDEDAEKIRKILKLNQKRESSSTVDKNWETLLKMVPKSTSAEAKVHDGSSSTSSVKEDSPTEIIPEIKISRVQTIDSVLKPNPKLKQRKVFKSDKKKEKQSDQQSTIVTLPKRKNIQTESTVTIECTVDTDTKQGDDVFLENVIVEVPELPKIHDSISNRIKRRLRKVISIGNSGETQLTYDVDMKATEQETIKSKSREIDNSRVTESQEIMNDDQQCRLVRSESWSTTHGDEYKLKLQKRRRSSLNNLDDIRKNP